MPSANVAVVAPPELFRPDAPVDHWIPLRTNRNGPIVKTAARHAPYDRVLFLDTDTFVAGDLTEVFNVLDAFDLALAHEPTRGWDYDTPAAKAFCELNTGLIAFRKNDKIDTFFSLWEKTYDAMRLEQNLKNDQPAFRTALWKSHALRHATLPSEYHLICGKGASIAWEAKLLHGRGNLPAIASIVNGEYGPRVFVPGWGLIFGYRGRRFWIKTFLSLGVNFLRMLINPGVLSPKQPPVNWLAADIDEIMKKEAQARTRDTACNNVADDN
jgi:hypothetical protein